jgi:hypothetical protein
MSGPASGSPVSELAGRLEQEAYNSYLWVYDESACLFKTVAGSLMRDAAKALRTLESDRDRAKGGEELAIESNRALRAGNEKVDLHVIALQREADQLSKCLKGALDCLEYVQGLKYANGNPITGWGVRAAIISEIRSKMEKAGG